MERGHARARFIGADSKSAGRQPTTAKRPAGSNPAVPAQQLNLFHNNEVRQGTDMHILSHNVPQAVQQGEQVMAEPEKVFTTNWDALVARLRSLVDDCVHERSQAHIRLKQWEQELERLDVLHERLNSVLLVAIHGTIPMSADDPKPSLRPEAAPAKDDSKPETTPHKDIIAAIIRRQGRSMSTSAIARQAHKDGTIFSSKGYRGIYSSVTTTLKRYDKLLFIRVRRGLWDLRERRQARMQPAAVALGASVTVKNSEGKIIYSEAIPQPHLN